MRDSKSWSHRHKPESTGKLITAGFRENNLPEGTYAVLCQGELMECYCGGSWIRTERFGLVAIHPELDIFNEAA